MFAKERTRPPLSAMSRLAGLAATVFDRLLSITLPGCLHEEPIIERTNQVEACLLSRPPGRQICSSWREKSVDRS